MAYVIVLRALFFLCIAIIVLSVLVNSIKKLFRKSPRLEQTLTGIVIVGVLSTAGYWLISRAIVSRRASQNERQAEDERSRTHRRETQDAIEALIATSDAVRDWKTSLCTRDYTSPILTSELQNALVRTDNRAVLITSSLSDMKGQAGPYVLSIASNLCRDARLQVELIASADEAKTVLADRSESPSYYAIAARVASVEKSESVSDDGDSTFVARGECSNLVFTGFDGFSIDMEDLGKPLR